MYFVFVKDISAKQMVSCTHLHKALRFPASEQAWVTTYQSKTTVDVGLTFKQGHCRPLDQSGNKQTNKQTVQSILLSMNNASVYLDCGFLGGKPSVPS